MNFVQPCSSLVESILEYCHAHLEETPMYRTFPDETASFSTPNVSTTAHREVDLGRDDDFVPIRHVLECPPQDLSARLLLAAGPFGNVIELEEYWDPVEAS